MTFQKHLNISPTKMLRPTISTKDSFPISLIRPKTRGPSLPSPTIPTTLFTRVFYALLPVPLAMSFDSLFPLFVFIPCLSIDVIQRQREEKQVRTNKLPLILCLLPINKIIITNK